MALNTVSVTGRLVADPTLKYLQDGTAVANFRVAVDRSYKNAKGEREADFFNVVVWRKTAETVANHLGKGRLVGISGKLQSRTYEKDGQTHYPVEIVAHEIAFLDRPKGDQAEAQGEEEPEAVGVGAADDDVPF